MLNVVIWFIVKSDMQQNGPKDDKGESGVARGNGRKKKRKPTAGVW